MHWKNEGILNRTMAVDLRGIEPATLECLPGEPHANPPDILCRAFRTLRPTPTDPVPMTGELIEDMIAREASALWRNRNSPSRGCSPVFLRPLFLEPVLLALALGFTQRHYTDFS